jgi:AraC-like DNA-binding protein
MADRQRIRAWRPALPGVAEVYHARITDHVYPMHSHDAWTLLIVDEGSVRYDLHRTEHGVLRHSVTLLPPHVPHNGRAVTPAGFQKRVLYLETAQLGEALIGPAVDRPVLADLLLRQRIHQVHKSLEQRDDLLEAEARLTLVVDRLRGHLTGQLAGHPASRTPVANPDLAHRLRELLDRHVVEGISLQEAASTLFAHPAHLVRVFSREFGLGPHQYLIGRRVDHARKLLLAGTPLREVATSAGFYDQPHFTRHFKHMLGVNPSHYAHSS